MLKELVRKALPSRLALGLDNALSAIDSSEDAYGYACAAFRKSATFSALCFVVFYSLQGLLESVSLSLAAFSACLFLALSRPFSAAARIEEELEKDLPFALRSIAVDLTAGASFEAAVENACKGYGRLSVEFSKALNGYRKGGQSMQESLRKLSERRKSLALKRSTAYLCSAYELGKSNNSSAVQGIVLLAREQLNMQKAAAREFSGKLVFYTLVFISAAALLPALFQLVVIIGSAVLSLTFTGEQALAATVFVFPLIDALIIVFIHQKTPLFMK
ncbi:MAG TPA: hypothetical protein VJA40_05810 [archaeon]|nr:hypothetical protein [archaeon]